LLPSWCQYAYGLAIITFSMLWAYKIWQYYPNSHKKESLADHFQ
jgi:hypothetical protein